MLNRGVCVFYRKDGTNMHFTWKAHAVYTVTRLFMVYQMSAAFIICTMKTTLTSDSHAHHTQGQRITENSTGQFLLVAFVLWFEHSTFLSKSSIKLCCLLN